MIALRDEIYEFSSKGKNSSCLKVGARPKGSINSGAQSPQYFSAWGLTHPSGSAQVIHVKQICPSPAPSPSLSPELSAPRRPTAPLAPAPAQGGTERRPPGRGHRDTAGQGAAGPLRIPSAAPGPAGPPPPSAALCRRPGGPGGPGGPGPRVPVPVPGGAGAPGALQLPELPLAGSRSVWCAGLGQSGSERLVFALREKHPFNLILFLSNAMNGNLSRTVLFLLTSYSF